MSTLKSEADASTKLKFIPPKEESENFPRYASYAAGIMKSHGTISAAKNSLNNRMWNGYGSLRAATHAFLLEAVAGEYFVLYEIKPGSTFKDLPWVKEYMGNYGHWNEITDYHRNSDYYGPKLKNGEIRTSHRARPMTTDEYVTWRLAVEHERLGIKPPVS